uniref:Gag-like protein n=1 Tax=Anopheles gambiae TaxID=7165 RepID=A0A0E4G8F4_ANOGA
MAAKQNATFRVDFSQIPKKPSRAEAIKFLINVLKLETDKLEKVQVLNMAPIISVEMKDPIHARQFVEAHDGKHGILCDGTEFNVPIKMEDNTQVVKILDVSANISNAEIKEILAAYGTPEEVLNTYWEAPSPFAGIKDGNRSTNMKIEKPIPSFLTIKGEIIKILYRGQKATCQYCDQPVHYGVTCTQNRKNTHNTYNKTSVNNRLFAEVAQQGTKNQNTKIGPTTYKPHTSEAPEKSSVYNNNQNPSTSRNNSTETLSMTRVDYNKIDDLDKTVTGKRLVMDDIISSDTDTNDHERQINRTRKARKSSN